MIDIIAKSKVNCQIFHLNLRYNKPEIADDFFTVIGQKLVSHIPKSSKTFKTHINKVNVIMNYNPLSIRELKETSFLLKINENSRVGNVSLSIIEKCFWELCKPIIYLFHLSLE